MANEFWELDGFPRERETLTGFEATRKVICDWNDRTFLRGLFMNWPGQIYPYALTWGARPIAIGIEPFGMQHQDALGADLAWYEAALLTIKYQTPGFGDTQPYPASKSTTKNLDRRSAISETLEPYVVTTRLDHEKFVWSDGVGLTEAESPVEPHYRSKYVLTRYNLLAVPTAVLSLAGTINSAAVTPILVGMDNLTFPINTLLFQQPTISTSASLDGTPSLDVTYRMVYKKNGWRKHKRNESEVDELIYHRALGAGAGAGAVGDAYAFPPEADFSVIFP